MRALIPALALVVVLPLFGDEPQRIAAGGVSVVVPPGWSGVTSLARAERKTDPVYADPKLRELQKNSESLTPSPVLTLSKNSEETKRNIAASFSIYHWTLPEARDYSLERLGKTIMTINSRGFTDAVVEQPIHEVTIAGLPGVEWTMRYTITTREGEHFPARVRMAIVRVGDSGYTLGITSPQDGPDEAIGMYDTIVKTLELGKP